MPLDSGSDLYIYKHPDVPASLLYLVRPYQPKDEAAIYRLVATAYEEEIDAPMGKVSCNSSVKFEFFLTSCPAKTLGRDVTLHALRKVDQRVLRDSKGQSQTRQVGYNL